jgi:hypothetical protein
VAVAWLTGVLWLATAGTVAAVALAAVACGWALGYAHRDFIDAGNRLGRLLAKRRLRWRNPLAWLAGEYRGAWRESRRLWREYEARARR